MNAVLRSAIAIHEGTIRHHRMERRFQMRLARSCRAEGLIHAEGVRLRRAREASRTIRASKETLRWLHSL